MKKVRIFCQTFATDLIDNMNDDKIERMLSLHYLSALSIKKLLSKNDRLVLMTDTKGKEMTKGFSYDEVLVELDSYPYVRPVKMSAYKLYSIEIFKGKTFIHLDNDVILFRPVEKFEDTLVQSSESNFMEYEWNNFLKNLDYLFPKKLMGYKYNYNPGVFGFTKDSKIRDLYFKTFIDYSNANIEHINNMTDERKKNHLKNEMQRLYGLLEEALLHYLCRQNNIKVKEHVPNMFPTKDYFPNENVDWRKIDEHRFEKWLENRYIHFIAESKNNHQLVEDVLLRLYSHYPKEIDDFLNKTLVP